MDMLLQIHEAQFFYLKLTRFSAGLLINFKERMIKDDNRGYVLSMYLNKNFLRDIFAYFATFAFK